MKKNAILADPFASGSENEKYDVLAMAPRRKNPRRDKRHRRSYLIIGDFYWQRILEIQNERGDADIKDVIDAAFRLVIGRYSIGNKCIGTIKSANRPRNKDTELKKQIRVSEDVMNTINCIQGAHRREKVTRQGLLEEGIDIIDKIDRSNGWESVYSEKKGCNE